MAQATVYDVAQRAGVSIATVSRVLNASANVNSQTRDRVLQAIDDLSFVPKAEASVRARKATGRIGVLAPFFTYPSFVQRLRGVALALSNSPYELVIYNVDSPARREAYLTSLALAQRLDGLVTMALPFDDSAAKRLSRHRLETVLIESIHPLFSSVEIDDQNGGRMAAEYLLSKRHKRYGFVGDSQVPKYAIHTSDLRLEGYRTALAEAGFPVADLYVSLAPHGLDNACTSALHLFDLPDPPDAIFAASDTQAMGVLKAARMRGIRVPDALAVIGFDDIDIADYIGLTTVRQQLEESGRVAVELLTTRLADRSRPVQHVKLPLQLVRRETA